MLSLNPIRTHIIHPDQSWSAVIKDRQTDRLRGQGGTTSTVLLISFTVQLSAVLQRAVSNAQQNILSFQYENQMNRIND